ncbi:MAG: protein kinase [Myxococcales bacterium]|nr:protein kinase [Myxococcales bacterium]
MSPRAIGPYVIEERLAAGGMAEVFVATRLGPHGFSKRVALKRILPQFARDPEFVAMFIEEARLVGKLAHPNIVQVFDFGEANGELYLTMELVDGSNINLLLRAVAARQESVPVDVALHIAVQMAQALHHAHRLRDDDGALLSIVHRDVSPANVLLTSTGHVKLADFGIATVRERTRLTEDGHVRGKLGYMSPEQVTGKPLDSKSDVFAISTVLTELLLGEPLFAGGSELDVLVRIRDVSPAVLEARRAELPPDVTSLLLQGLSRRSSERPSAGAFADACAEIMRRRSMGHGPDRLAALLVRLGLVTAPAGRRDSLIPRASEEALQHSIGADTATEALLDGFGPSSPAIYAFGDGAAGELLDYPRLVEAITSGSVHGGSVITKEGVSHLATDLPELTRFLSSPGLHWRPDELDEGLAQPVDPIELVREVWRIVESRQTGVLHLWDEARRKKIYFHEGRPEFAASTDRSERLGEFLVAHDHCLRMEIEMGLALLARYGGRLGDALIGLGVLRPIDLFGAIRQQVRSRILECFRWTEGSWCFLSGERSHEESFAIGYEPETLLWDAVAQIPSSHLAPGLSSLHLRRVALVAAPLRQLSVFAIPERWARLIAELDGSRPLGAVLAGAELADPNSLEQVQRAIVFALVAGLIEPTD